VCINTLRGLKGIMNPNTMIEKPQKRTFIEVFEQFLKYLSKDEFPHTKTELARESGVNFHSVNRILTLFQLLAKYKVISLPLEDRPDLYVPRKLSIRKPKIV